MIEGLGQFSITVHVREDVYHGVGCRVFQIFLELADGGGVEDGSPTFTNPWRGVVIDG